MIETLGEGFHGENLVVRLWKVDPSESGSLDRFAFLRWYVELVEDTDIDKLEEEVSIESTEKSELSEEGKNISRGTHKDSKEA